MQPGVQIVLPIAGSQFTAVPSINHDLNQFQTVTCQHWKRTGLDYFLWVIFTSCQHNLLCLCASGFAHWDNGSLGFVMSGIFLKKTEAGSDWHLSEPERHKSHVWWCVSMNQPCWQPGRVTCFSGVAIGDCVDPWSISRRNHRGDKWVIPLSQSGVEKMQVSTSWDGDSSLIIEKLPDHKAEIVTVCLDSDLNSDCQQWILRVTLVVVLSLQFQVGVSCPSA